MFFPDYKNSIVNLMSSIIPMQGIDPLACLPHRSLERFENIVFIFYDGLGYDYLESSSQHFMKSHTIARVTSVFPSTTAAAATTLVTGLPPSKHAITGWTVWLREMGMVCNILPYRPKAGGGLLSGIGLDPLAIFDSPSIFSQIMTRKKYAIYPEYIIHSDYNRIMMPGVSKYGYNTTRGFFSQLSKVLKKGGKKFIYTYFEQHDALSHEFGSKSREVRECFALFADKLHSLYRLQNNTAILFVSDHGHIDTDRKKVIHVNDYPKLYECLVMPLCGGSRVTYAYVRPSKVAQFERQLDRFSHALVWHKSPDLVKRGVFGPGRHHPKLLDRIGDYILIMKDDWTICDSMFTRPAVFLKSVHGGTSKEEMFVPVILLKT